LPVRTGNLPGEMGRELKTYLQELFEFSQPICWYKRRSVFAVGVDISGNSQELQFTHFLESSEI